MMITKTGARALLLAVTLGAFAGSASAATLFEDTFNRGNNNTVGNGWAEYGDGSSDVAILRNALVLKDNQNGTPDAAAASMEVSTLGYSNITVQFRWRSLRENRSASPDLQLSWAKAPYPSITAEGSWTQVFTGSNGGTDWFTQTITLAALAQDSALRLMFWTKNVHGDDTNEKGFLIDYVKVEGTAIPTVPLPAGAPLLLAGLGGLAALRRRKRA